MELSIIRYRRFTNERRKIGGKNYNKDVEVEYIKLDSGAAINEGIIGSTIDVGCMGISPAISGVSKGIPYKAIANLCSQSHGLMSSDMKTTISFSHGKQWKRT